MRKEWLTLNLIADQFVKYLHTAFFCQTHWCSTYCCTEEKGEAGEIILLCSEEETSHQCVSLFLHYSTADTEKDRDDRESPASYQRHSLVTVVCVKQAFRRQASACSLQSCHGYEMSSDHQPR